MQKFAVANSHFLPKKKKNKMCVSMGFTTPPYYHVLLLSIAAANPQYHLPEDPAAAVSFFCSLSS